MGLVVRHSGAPFADGEVLAAGPAGDPDGLELDIASFYAEFNGAVDNVNFKAAGQADLSGTKLLIASLAVAKVVNDAIDATVLLDNSIVDAKFAAGSVTAAKIKANALSNFELREKGIFQEISQTVFTEIISDSIVTTVGTGAVLVVWIGRLIAFPIGSGTVPGASQFLLKRANDVLHATFNGTRHFGTVLGVNSETTISMMFMDTGRPGGVSVDYSIEGLQETGTQKSLFDDQHLYLLNLGA